MAWEREWVEERFYTWYTGGVALPLTRATLRIDYADERPPLELAGDIESGSQGARFTAQLEVGAAHLRARLLDDLGHARGAYYVQVRLLEAESA